MLISQERELSKLLPKINRAQSNRLHLTLYFVTRLVLKNVSEQVYFKFQRSEIDFRGEVEGVFDFCKWLHKIQSPVSLNKIYYL